MARYLVIEFDNNDQADALRAQINAATVKGKAFRVVGLFARPGKNCSCSSSHQEHVKRISKEAKPVKGQSLGLWVCPDCHRPRFGSQWPKNLIAREEILEPTTFTEIDWMSSTPSQGRWRYYPNELALWVEPIPKEN